MLGGWLGGWLFFSLRETEKYLRMTDFEKLRTDFLEHLSIESLSEILPAEISKEGDKQYTYVAVWRQGAVCAAFC